MGISEIKYGEFYSIEHSGIGKRVMRIDLVCDVFIHGVCGDNKKDVEKKAKLFRGHSNLFISKIVSLEPLNAIICTKRGLKMKIEYGKWYWITDPREGDVWYPIFAQSTEFYMLDGDSRPVTELNDLRVIEAIMPIDQPELEFPGGHVPWCGSEDDREELIQAVMEAKPDMISRKL
jgi:hypothetical protein